MHYNEFSVRRTMIGYEHSDICGGDHPDNYIAGCYDDLICPSYETRLMTWEAPSWYSSPEDAMYDHMGTKAIDIGFTGEDLREYRADVREYQRWLKSYK